MYHPYRQYLAATLLSLLLVTAGCRQGSVMGVNAPATVTPPVAIDAWAASAADNTLVTDPTTHLTSSQIAFLRQIAAHTWSFLSGPDLNPTTHFLRNSVLLAGSPD